MSGSGSGEERTWTVWEEKPAPGRLHDGSNLTDEAKAEYCFEVVEASAWRAEREAREKAEEALRELDEALNRVRWNVSDGSDPASPVLIERESWNRIVKAHRSLSALPVQKEKTIADNINAMRRSTARVRELNESIHGPAPQPEEEKDG